MTDKPTRVDVSHNIIHAADRLRDLRGRLRDARQLVQPVPDKFDPADFEDLLDGSAESRDEEAAQVIEEVAGELETTVRALRQLKERVQALSE